MHDTEIEPRTQVHNEITWVDLENPSPEALADLERRFSLQAIHVRESLQKVQHVEVEREGQYLFLVLHVPVLMTHTDKIHTTQVGVFLGKDFLVTIRGGASPCMTDLFEVCSLSAEKAEEYFKQGAAYLLYRLINSLLADISDMADDVNNELDEIEDLVFEPCNWSETSTTERFGRPNQHLHRTGYGKILCRQCETREQAMGRNRRS
jgi:Mg2+ and Co2+ transporter CorA